MRSNVMLCFILFDFFFKHSLSLSLTPQGPFVWRSASVPTSTWNTSLLCYVAAAGSNGKMVPTGFSHWECGLAQAVGQLAGFLTGQGMSRQPPKRALLRNKEAEEAVMHIACQKERGGGAGGFIFVKPLLKKDQPNWLYNIFEQVLNHQLEKHFFEHVSAHWPSLWCLLFAWGIQIWRLWGCIDVD